MTRKTIKKEKFKMNKLKKFLAGIMAMTCMLSTVSCFESKEINESKAEQQSSQIQEMMEKSYKAIEMEAELPISEIHNLSPIGDTGKILITGYSVIDEQYTPQAFITDYDFIDFQEIDLGIEASDSYQPNMNYVVTNSGKIFAVVTITDYGDFEMPDFNDPDFDYENFDFEAMDAAATTHHHIYALDETGNVISENEIKGLEKYGDEELNGGQVYLNECFALGSDNVGISISGSMDMTYVTVDAEGNISEPLDFSNGEYFYPSGTDIDGNFVYITYDETGTVLKTLDAETMSVSPDVVSFDETSPNFSDIIKGSGDYRVYLSSNTSLYGLKADGTLDEIINWIDSDLTGDYINGLIPVDGGDFLITENNWTNGETNIYRLTKRDVSEIENVQIINMVVEYADQGVTERVKEFNKTNGEYRIKVEDYSQYYVWDEESQKQTNTPDKQLKQDLAAGKDVDIICMSGNSSLFSNLSRKGALVDMYEMLEKDAELSKDDLVPTILSICETDGKLTSLASSFYISTLGCKSKHFDKENWTIDEFIETCKNLPEGMKPFKSGNTNFEIFSRLIYNSADFIDYNNATCSFNTPEFIKLLEFCNEYPNAAEGDEIDWENATNEEMNAYWEETEVALRNDKALLADIYIDNPRSYARAVQGEIGDAVTLVGNPSNNGTGATIYPSTAYAIMENSDCKDICWDFIKEVFSEENQSYQDIYDIPALRSAFDKMLDDSMEPPYYLDENGKKVEYEDTHYIGGKEIKINPLTQEERDLLEAYIINAKPAVFYYNDEVTNIITEETEAYFAGDKTAEQTAEIIQNRVSILISEQS